MGSEIYAIANIGRFKLYVGKGHELRKHWPQMLKQLNAGTYPHPAVQAEWQTHSAQRTFSFHTAADLEDCDELLNIEQFLTERGQL